MHFSGTQTKRYCTFLDFTVSITCAVSHLISCCCSCLRTAASTSTFNGFVMDVHVCICMCGYEYMYHSIPAKRPCSTFQGINVTASTQTYIQGKHPCGPNRELCLSAHGRLPRTLRCVSFMFIQLAQSQTGWPTLIQVCWGKH